MAYAKATGKTYYKIHSIEGAGKSVRVTKFNADIEPESSYVMNHIDNPEGGFYDCQCPASKFDCRHKDILKRIKAADKIDSDLFFCFETKSFHEMKDM